MTREAFVRMVTAVGLLGLAVMLTPTLLSQAQQPTTPAAAIPREGGDRRGPVEATKEVEALKEELRQLKGQLVEQRRQTAAIVNHLTLAPEVEVEPEDYLQARSRFQTK